jgi:hypothetical protein
MKKIVISISILLIVSGLWMGRNQIRDALYSSQQPALPVAVERGEIPAPAPAAEPTPL